MLKSVKNRWAREGQEWGSTRGHLQRLVREDLDGNVMQVYNRDPNRINYIFKIVGRGEGILIRPLRGWWYSKLHDGRKSKKDRFSFLVFKKFWKTNFLKFCRRKWQEQLEQALGSVWLPGLGMSLKQNMRDYKEEEEGCREGKVARQTLWRSLPTP